MTGGKPEERGWLCWWAHKSKTVGLPGVAEPGNEVLLRFCQ